MHLTCILLVLFRQRPNFTTGALSGGIYYTPQLTQKMISDAETSPIVQDQMNRQMLTFSLSKTFEARRTVKLLGTFYRLSFR